MAEIKQGGDQFASRWGLIATVLGMAVGTGNIWRFPREVASNNGGAFILICFLALFIWAVLLICAESVFGKTLGQRRSSRCFWETTDSG